MRTLPKLIIILPLAIYMGAAAAEENTYPFNIPSQPLVFALNAVSRQTGLQPFYADSDIAGKQSPELKGNYSKRQVVKILLAQSGLSHTFTSDNTVAIKAAPVKKAVPPVSKKTDDSTTVLPPMTVTAKDGYDAKRPLQSKLRTPQRHQRHQDRYAAYGNAAQRAGDFQAGFERSAGDPS